MNHLADAERLVLLREAQAMQVVLARVVSLLERRDAITDPVIRREVCAVNVRTIHRWSAVTLAALVPHDGCPPPPGQPERRHCGMADAMQGAAPEFVVFDEAGTLPDPLPLPDRDVARDERDLPGSLEVVGN